jgi:hypothetical protein
MVETNVSYILVTGILSQHDDDNILYLVPYVPKKHSSAEINYEMNDKELLTIIHAFKECNPLLKGSSHTIEVIFDD